ncbi:uncharacterized protein B0I36DRAFT_411061 [Microdochium trichocladiopsis]|uniref:Phospho-2-dehydro-3-deoxyheptonate aldolase n=1 Tax=Microdochium trichocladiopsis TaxID=1682393 RepID=A0A9P8Y4J0_9PEZI|nr:uncharacterized protein B0I36DRAFT_411061 [Microdochium trichocladiopsis]KAH7029239.1 hypothetical protein B0I36DRAFT_411061 [Microdochium trichocladiopsis]
MHVLDPPRFYSQNTVTADSWETKAVSSIPPPASAPVPEPRDNNLPLPSPKGLLQDIPQTTASLTTVSAGKKDVADVVCGRDPLNRLLVVVGPCSIHDPKEALEYCDRLLQAREKHKDELLIKPRTVTGWKGLIMDPDMDDSFNVNKGLRLGRQLLAEITSRGMPVASEMLSLISTRYVDDMLSLGFVGARTTESQLHRELASASEFPVGFKNGTDGSLITALNAVRAAQVPHRYLSICENGAAAVLQSRGNNDCFLVLRGGSKGTNYDSQSTSEAEAEFAAHGALPRIMVDCSHGNAQNHHENQPKVAEDLAKQIAAGRTGIMGVMLESYINGGNRSGLRYGVSVTDGCIGWESTTVVKSTLVSQRVPCLCRDVLS